MSEAIFSRIGGAPRRALKAGSMRPLLADKTALMTPASTVGKASLRMASFFCASVKGRGGLAGASSSAVVLVAAPGASAGAGAAAGAVVVFLLESSPPVMPDSWISSSSISRGLAVVGDSAPGDEGVSLSWERGVHVSPAHLIKLAWRSGPSEAVLNVRAQTWLPTVSCGFRASELFFGLSLLRCRQMTLQRRG